MKLPKYKLNEKSTQKDYIFNIYGSTATSLISVLLLMTVSYLRGETEAGVFTLSYSTAQMMYTVAMFETRTVQVTDPRHRFAFSDFAAFRIFTVAAMMLSSAAFVFLKGFGMHKVALTLMLCVYMALLSVSDVFQGSLQLNGYLKNAGFSLGTQVILAAACFTATLILTGNILVSCAAMAAAVLIWILLYDVPYARNFGSLKPAFNAAKQKLLFKSAAPLFISIFLNQYSFNTPKYAIDKFLTETDQSHYGYLVMPAFVINLISMFAFRPQLVPLSEKWERRDLKSFHRTLLLLYGWIIAASLAALLGGWFLGIPVLNLLYHTSLGEYRVLLEVLLIGGGFSAGSTLTIALLAVIGKQKHSLPAYVCSFIIALFVPNLLVKHSGFTGAVISYLVITVSLFVLLFAIFLICLKKAEKESTSETTEDKDEIHG